VRGKWEEVVSDWGILAGIKEWVKKARARQLQV